MRASNWAWLETTLLLVFLPWVAGCSKEVKAEFPRPPATATTHGAEEEPPARPPDPIPAEPELGPPVEEEPLPEEAAPPAPDSPRPRPRPSTETPVEGTPEEPPSTQLMGAEEIDPELASKLDRASSLLGSVRKRTLTIDQEQQLVAARAFVTQARQALDDGDQRRALVLIDKGLILAQDVERLSRP